MVERRSFPTGRPGCEIHVVTEQMNDGMWAVVVSVMQNTETATRNVDLPVIEERFDSQANAEDAGLRAGMDWVDRNTAADAA